MLTTKNQEKKVLKKLIRAQHAITADTQIVCSNQPTQNLVICNAGLSTGLQLETLLEAAGPHGTVLAASMLPGKSYCFMRTASVADAQRIHDALHARSRLAQNTGVLYLSYSERVPATSSTWDGPLPAGLLIIEEFIDEGEEAQLLAACRPNNIDEQTTATLKHRQVQHFGYAFQYDTNNVDRTKPLRERPIPAACAPLWPRLRQMNVAQDDDQFRPDQLTVNAYASGHGIPAHVDTHSPFEAPIVSLSLAGGVVMEFRLPATGAQRSVWLPRRSLLVMDGEARYAWTHGITPRRMDVVPMVAEGSGGGGGGLTVRQRDAERVSLTFRQLRAAEEPCRCAYPELCDTVLANGTRSAHPAEQQEPGDAAALELANVHRVYDTIAGHFSDTRHSPWPQVLDFVNGLGDEAAVLADIGCGNGKYLLPSAHGAVQQQQRLRLGGDRSAGLLDVCRQRGLNVFRCDCLRVPLRDGCADGCICIAVVHHLATEERRLQALREIARILRPGGQALVYVWAKNQAKDAHQSSYLRQNKANRAPMDAETIDAAHVAGKTPAPVVEYVNGLPVHTNRTQFAAQDMLVPWKLRAAGDADAAPASQQFLRYYHVFEEGELEALVRRVQGVRVVRSYYDQGNWCVVFERTADV